VYEPSNYGCKSCDHPNKEKHIHLWLFCSFCHGRRIFHLVPLKNANEKFKLLPDVVDKSRFRTFITFSLICLVFTCFELVMSKALRPLYRVIS
jgi:hypothetical protein